MPSGAAHLKLPFFLSFVFLRGFLRRETGSSCSSQLNGGGLGTHAIQLEFSALTALPKDWKQKARQAV